jgi:tetratricopeptide (TPR) repeat protein
LIEKIVGFAEKSTPTALIGTGGIGKTTIALTVLHHARIKKRFGENRRFVRCDRFPATLTNFLNQLSKVTGAGVENPESLSRLLPFLSSARLLIVLDNVESILDPQGKNSQEIYASVEELCRLENVCICITSSITTIPPDCETLDVPTLSMESACDVFYRIYKSHGRSDSIDDILKQLDFHPLSITLLATVAQQHQWDNARLAREWEQRRIGVLQTEHDRGIAATIELSLASPMFEKLGPDARGLLGVIAFFPQGVDENNLGWLLPTISDGATVFDAFCILSLTHRNDGFITMLAPLREYLGPKDPTSSTLLSTIKERYFTRMSIEFDRNKPVFDEARWITSEDMNVEHLLNIFTSIDATSDDAWNACPNFLRHLYWHKPRHTALGPKIEALPDRHPSKPSCLFELSQLFELIGNQAERKRILIHTLELERGLGNDHRVVLSLMELSDSNRLLGLYEEGIHQIKEGLVISERLGDAVLQAGCWDILAWLLYGDKQLDAAEEAASRTNTLLPEKGQEYLVCRSHRLLGDIYRSKGDGKKAIHHFEAALTIASPFNWHDEQFWIHYCLVNLFLDQDDFDNAQAHIKQAKLHVVNNVFQLGRAMEKQAMIWQQQGKFEDAKPETLRAIEIYQKLGASEDVEDCKTMLREIEGKLEQRQCIPGQSEPNGELLTSTNPSFLVRDPRSNTSPRLFFCIPFWRKKHVSDSPVQNTSTSP